VHNKLPGKLLTMSKNQTVSFFITLSLFLFTASQTVAQNQSRPTWFSFELGHQEYHGDLGNEILDFQVGYDWTIGLSIDRYISNRLDFKISTSYGELDYNNFFNTSFLNSQVLLKYKLLGNRQILNPYAGSGFGITNFWNNRTASGNGASFHIPVQIGVDYHIKENVSASFHATYNRSFSDELDGGDFGGRGHDDFMIYAVGIKFSLSKSKDSDNDGIKDENDLCPKIYGSSFWGCPDTDKDGLYDNEDDCPSVPGKKTLNGCPDTDGDGVEDTADACPDQKGSYRHSGCPDDDEDGVPNQIDECPDRSGVTTNNGCPEGVSPTPAAKKLTPDMATKVEEISKNINFNLSSSVLDSTAQQNLDQLADIMLNDKALQLIIRSYTDNTGSPSQNLELSLERANTVKEYLVAKGLDETRIYAFGYGQAKPVASNATKEGRAQNRRVEFQLYYK